MIRGAQADFDSDDDIDGSDLAAYAAGYMSVDLDNFSKYFGHKCIF